MGNNLCCSLCKKAKKINVGVKEVVGKFLFLYRNSKTINNKK